MASDDTEIEGKDSPPAIAAARVRFNQWLGELYRRSHIHTHVSCVGSISVQMLAAVSRQYVAGIYTPPVAGALLGLVPYAPVPGPQMEIFASYRQRTADTGTQANDEPSRRITRNSSTTGPAQSNFISSEDETNEFLATRLVHALRPLFEEGRASRQSAIRQLGDLARDLVRQVGYGVEADPISLQKIYAERLMSADVVLSDVARFNVACLALWLAYLCANTKLDRDTVVARRSDAFVLLRLFRGLCLNELEDEDGYELAGLDRAASSLCRLIGTWRQLHTFLSKELKVPVSSVDWKEFTIERTQQPVNLLGQNGFEKLQAALHSAETTAYAAGQHTKALEYHNAALAANLAYYFGARLNEAVRLTVSDVVLRSQQPYICIWRSKRGKSRVVYALHVPVGVVEELKHERDQRYAVSHDLSAPLLVGDNGEAIDGQVISQRVIETLEQLQRRGEEDAMPVVFHTLRHEFANRLMVLEVPLLDIANSMGHASPDTTTGSYLHCFDFLQREQLQGHLACTGEEVALSAKALGARLGVGRTAVLALIRRYEKATGRSVAFIAGMDKNTLKPALEMGVGRCDRQVIPYNEIVRLLAWRLGES